MTSSASLYVFILSITLISCSKNQESEFIKYSEIGDTQDTNENHNNEDSTGNYNVPMLLNTEYLDLEADTIMTFNDFEFMDRFKNGDSEKYLLLKKTDSILFKMWYYDDSSSTHNAFYNLMDCFGKNCNSIDLYSDSYSEKYYNLLFVTEKEVFWIKSKENQKIITWENFIKQEYDTGKYCFIIEQKSNERMNWLELIPIENTFKLRNLQE